MKTFVWTALFLCAWPAVAQKTADLAGERGQASQQFSLAESHFLRGENVKALEAYRKTRELFLAASDQLGQGHTWTGEADVLLRLGDEHEALDAYRHARELFLAAGDQLGQGDTWRGEARVHDRLGEKKEARDACETARQHFRAARQSLLATGEKLRLAHTWYGEAEILYRLSEDKSELASHTQALYDYREARKLYLAAGDKLGQGNTWRGEANILGRLAKNEKAVVDADRTAQKVIDAYRTARNLLLAVSAHEGQGDTWLGEAEFWKSMAEKKPVTQDPTGAVVKLRKAKKAAEASITEYQSAGVLSNQIAALLLKAEVEVKGQEATAALARAMAQRTAVSLGPLRVGIFYEGTKEPAAHSSEGAILLNDSWRETGTTEEDRTNREQNISRAYDFLVAFRARQRGKAAEALGLAEEARSRVLLDLIAAPPNPGGMTSAPDPTAERQRLETEISQIEEQLRGSPTLDQQARLRVQRLQLELRWNAAGKRSFPQEPPLDTAAIQNLARETGPLLVYYATESEVWGFLIRPETAEIYARSIPISRQELKQKVPDFVHDLANPSSELRAGARALELWHLLIEPFVDRLPKNGRLVLVPHGPLHELPFEALRDAAGKRLFESWQISIAPSVSALALARRRHAAPLASDSFLGFSSGQGLNLPAEEVAKISAFFDTDKPAYHPTVASYENYVDHVAQARQLLMSTRGVYVEGSRTETYLEIEPTPKAHDNRLTAAEIATIPLKAELVTLAACDTSYGQALLSDERLDVTRSFLIAGATAVLATRWSVPEDETTSRFLADFYRAYRKGGPGETGLRKDEALTEARRLSRERGDPAQVWAGWVLIGDAR